MSETAPGPAPVGGIAGRFGAAPRWMKIALVASVAANVLVVGVVAGSLWRVRHAAAHASAFGVNLAGYATTLPAERRGMVRRAFAEQREALRPLRQAARAARRDLEAQLVVEPFDKARFSAANERLIEAETKVRLAAGQVISEVAAGMTPAERQGFVKWRMKHRGPGPRGEDDGGDRPGGGGPRKP